MSLSPNGYMLTESRGELRVPWHGAYPMVRNIAATRPGTRLRIINAPSSPPRCEVGEVPVVYVVRYVIEAHQQPTGEALRDVQAAMRRPVRTRVERVIRELRETRPDPWPAFEAALDEGTGRTIGGELWFRRDTHRWGVLSVGHGLRFPYPARRWQAVS